MKEFKCNVAQKGFFAGAVYSIDTVTPSLEEKAANLQNEIERLHAAEQALRQSINNKRSSEENAEILETVLSILDDETFSERIEKAVTELSMTASAAVEKTSKELCAMLGDVNSDYIRSRQDDIRGVAGRLMAILDGTDDGPKVRSAVCAEEISPAQLSSIEDGLIGAMLTDKGSPNSHASILAGNLNIPYLYGNPEAVAEAVKSDFIIVDSESATVITDPDDDVKNKALEKMEQILHERVSQKQSQNDDDDDLPQCRTRICANIEGEKDIEALVKSGADGVGLFRTEFLFLNRDKMPTEQEQYDAYSAVAQAMGNREVVIRTMDIGSDKKTQCVEIPEESNPALGLRGVRVSLERKDLFKTQLRALLRAAVNGNIKVMFPMIVSEWEIDEIKQHVQQAAEELENEGVPYRIPVLGIMVETPAAALCAEKLAKKAGFFSIGTNDLTQYTLAIDREAQGLDRYFNPYHEAVFRLIAATADGGHKYGINTCVCGQLAADPEAVKRLIMSGVDQLSVPIGKVKTVRKLVALAEKEIDEQTSTPEEGLEVAAVADGEVIPMSEIPDPVFSGATLGECFGILPSNGNVYSPVSGTVVSVADAGHAITIESYSGRSYLVHVGIDTVSLGKKAFVHHVSQGEDVEANQLIMEADLDMIRDAGLSTVIVVVALN